jgi:hypothetical protein
MFAFYDDFPKWAEATFSTLLGPEWYIGPHGKGKIGYYTEVFAGRHVPISPSGNIIVNQAVWDSPAFAPNWGGWQ